MTTQMNYEYTITNIGTPALPIWQVWQDFEDEDGVSTDVSNPVKHFTKFSEAAQLVTELRQTDNSPNHIVRGAVWVRSER